MKIDKNIYLYSNIIIIIFTRGIIINLYLLENCIRL